MDGIQDKTSTPDELADIKVQLAEEQKAVVARDEAIAKKDAKLAELETALSEAKQSSEAEVARNEAISADLVAVKEARDQAVSKCLDMAKALNPTIPQDIIGGGTIEEIDASVEKGKALVASVTQYLESEASKAKVPAGAPTRGTISLEGMSPKEKIAYGIQQKGGT